MVEGIKKNFFEQKIKPILLYVGTIGAGATSIGYIILMFVLVLGFKAQTSWVQSLTFALVNALVGFVIMQFLKMQGIDFAKQLPENMEVMKQWNSYHRKIKKQKYKTMEEFWKKTMIQDAITKVSIICLTTAGIIYIVIEGSQDYNMLLLSVVNLIMFACFGLISLVKAYDFYNLDYIPYIKEQLNESENENKADVEVAQTESDKQTDDNLHIDRGIDILESSDNISNTCNYIPKSMVLDINNRDNSVLGSTPDSSSTPTVGINSLN